MPDGQRQPVGEITPQTADLFDRVLVMPEVGTCPDPEDPRRQKPASSEGDVLVRLDSESAEWPPRRNGGSGTPRRARQKEARKEFAATVAALDSAGRVRDRDRGFAPTPALAFAWKVDADTALLTRTHAGPGRPRTGKAVQKGRRVAACARAARPSAPLPPAAPEPEPASAVTAFA